MGFMSMRMVYLPLYLLSALYVAGRLVNCLEGGVVPQLSLYLTDENFEILRARSAESGLSMSKYANRLIELDAANSGWPMGFWALYGCLDDESFVAPSDSVPADDPELGRMFDEMGS